MSTKDSSEDTNNISFSTLIIMNRLGRGYSSHVFKTQSIKSKQYYAMKAIEKSFKAYSLASLKKQIKIHKLLKNEFICKFFKYFEDESNHYLITEYCNRGELTKFLMRPVSEKKLRKVLAQISHALHYLHTEVGVVHGDIKLSNILISGPRYKLCDFGFSYFIHQTEGSSNGPFGTLMYLSPQLLTNRNLPHYKQADVWALGICILSLMCQGNPYQTDCPYLLRNRIINGEYLKLNKKNFPKYSSQFLEVVSRMLEQNHNQRITPQNILRIPIIENALREKDSSETKTVVQNTCEESEYAGLKTDQQNEKKYGSFNEEDVQSHNRSKFFESDKEDQNKSIFNSTLDTLVDPEQTQNCMENMKTWSYCLKSQRHQTQNSGYIEVLPTHEVKIKVDKVEFKISANSLNLEILKGSKATKLYTIDEVLKTEKINNLYNYGIQLISVLKKKQCLRQCMIAGKYYWQSKISVGCLIDQDTIVEKLIGEPKLRLKKIHPNGQTQSAVVHQYDSNKYSEWLSKGEAFFRNSGLTK